MRKMHSMAGGLLLAYCLLTVSTSCLPAPADRKPLAISKVESGKSVLDRPNPGLKPVEDWTTPFLNTSQMRPAVPIVTSSVDEGDFTRQIVSLQWRPYDSIYLYIIKPKVVLNPPPVLFLYGYPTSTKRFLNNSYCSRITAGGCAAIGFDTALTGERFRMRPMREWFVSEMPESLSTSAHDVQLILNYLATRNDLDMTRIGIFGQGSGGTISILAAGADPRIKAVDILTPWGDWPHWAQATSAIPKKDKSIYTLPKFQGRVAPLDPVIWLARLKDRQLRLQFNDDDAAVPAECRETMKAALPREATFVNFPTNKALYAASAGGHLFDWMAKQLNAKPAPSQITATPPAKP